MLDEAVSWTHHSYWKNGPAFQSHGCVTLPAGQRPGPQQYRDMEDRLLARSVVMDLGYATPCWYWLGRVEPNGYAKVGLWDSKTQQARNYWVHRLAYETFKGCEIPEDFHVDHRCKQVLCINPAHLECVPQRVNAHERVSKKRGKGGQYR